MKPRRLVVIDPRRTLERLRSTLPAATRVLVVDALGRESKAELLAAFARDLALPPTFGHNFDALEDSLGDALARRPVALFVLEDDALEPRSRKMLASILADAVADDCTITTLVRSQQDESE